MGGVYKEVVPDERVVATEKFDMSWCPSSAVVTTTLTETGGMTTVTYAAKEEREMVLRSPMNTGVKASYARLERMLAMNFA
jgi:uncharacterized protein YndB with AHSA1/START domain